MAEPATADAAAPARREGPLGARPSVSVSLIAPATRFIFRGDGAAAEVCGEAFGCALPRDPCRALHAAGRVALWLGPDEWLLLAPEPALATLSERIEAALGSHPHALVDVSHRQAGLVVEGPGAELLLNTGCLLDLAPEAFPIDMATRTVLAKAEIVLWRQGAQSFRVEVWRSFVPYVLDFLAVAERGLA